MPPRDPEELRRRLRDFLAPRVAPATVEVEPPVRMAGGASRETWAVDVEIRHEDRIERLPLVLRRDPGPSQVQTDRRVEFHVLRAAHDAGVPVPRVRWLGGEPEPLGARFLLMDRIEGETLGRRLIRDAGYARARQVLTRQLGQALARIHAIDWQAIPSELPGARDPHTAPAAGELRRYEELFRLIAPEPHPAFEIAIRWLREHLPQGGRRCLVHGDYRVGNIVFGPEGLRAVLDWELAHVGDPMEDLGWLCVRSWRFGSDGLPAGGVGTREELFAAYEEAGGEAVDPQRVRFWEVFGNLKWGVICIAQARTHLDGHVRSMELAALGRRTAEVEWELLELTEERRR